MKTTVIYHSADYDGIFCREIARKFLPDAELIGWNFGDKPLPLSILDDSQIVYVLDLPVDRVFGLTFGGKEKGSGYLLNKVIWIDHHKTSIDTHPKDIPGYRIDGVAACRLAWQWFTQNQNGPNGLPEKMSFLDRVVIEPLAVRLAGEYDIWNHRGDGDLELQYGLKTEEPDIHWEWLFDQHPEYAQQIIAQGKLAMKYTKNTDTFWLAEAGYVIEWEGLKFLAMNSVMRGSGILESKDVPATGHDALMLYGYRGKYWTVSLYHAKHNTGIDLSEIAKKHGGGGHRGACGFTCDKLPF